MSDRFVLFLGYALFIIAVCTTILYKIVYFNLFFEMPILQKCYICVCGIAIILNIISIPIVFYKTRKEQK